jgi:ElaB/YqjD/DUF883 family membrane-anchored ribosome-binding protein
MAVMSKHRMDAKHSSEDGVSSGLEDLRSDFAQLREDVSKLLANALGAGRNGAAVLKDDASTAAGDIKECLNDIKQRGVESVERIGDKIGEHSLMSAAIAFGVGFVLAKLLARR